MWRTPRTRRRRRRRGHTRAPRTDGAAARSGARRRSLTSTTTTRGTASSSRPTSRSSSCSSHNGYGLRGGPGRRWTYGRTARPTRSLRMSALCARGTGTQFREAERLFWIRNRRMELAARDMSQLCGQMELLAARLDFNSIVVAGPPPPTADRVAVRDARGGRTPQQRCVICTANSGVSRAARRQRRRGSV